MPPTPTDRDLLVEAVTLLRPLVVAVEKLEGRVDLLEALRDRARGWIAGAAAVSAALGGAGGAVLTRLLVGH